MNKLFLNLLFFSLLISLFWFLNLDYALFLPPQGIHFWRQTDSISFVQVFYNDGNSLFEPRLFNLENIQGNAASEFPIIYYLTAQLYHFFGEKEFIIKIIHLAIIYTSIVLIFWFVYDYLKDFFYAIFISFFLFTSTILTFYSVNFLPDIEALGFAIIGWYLVVVGYNKKKYHYIYAGTFFFTLSALIKPTYLINPIACFSFSLIQYIDYKINKKSLSSSILKDLVLILISMLMVLTWFSYVIYYNKLYHSIAFLTSLKPLWEVDSTEILKTWNVMTQYWGTEYFTLYSWLIIALALIFQVVYFKRINKKIALLTGIIFLGSFCFFILYYIQFKNHDYYLLTMIPFVMCLLIGFLFNLSTLFPGVFKNNVFKFFLFIMLVAGIRQTKFKLERRFDHSFGSISSISENLKNIRPELEKLNIPSNSIFIVFPDDTPNGGLYYLNRKGWIIKSDQELIIKIFEYKKAGAKYIVLTVDDLTYKKTLETIGKKIFDNGKAAIYKI